MTIKRNRIRLTIAAYCYECWAGDTFMSDFEYDVLALKVYEQREIETGNGVYDRFFKENVEPHTGMWIRKHPDFHSGKLTKFVEYVKRYTLCI